MRSAFIIFCLMIYNLAIDAQNYSYLNDKPVGFGERTTGAIGGEIIVVSNLAELEEALESGNKNTRNITPKTIFINGRIELTKYFLLQYAENKTIIGLPGASLVNITPIWNTTERNNYPDEIPEGETALFTPKNRTGVLYLKQCKNIIIRNLHFESGGVLDIDGFDNLCLDQSSNIWVDHCDFQDGTDGNFDITNQSDSISVSWCKFWYEKYDHGVAGSGDGSSYHALSNLIGSSNDESRKELDGGKLNVTFYNCFWAQGCASRMPLLRFGKVHSFNCLFDCPNNPNIPKSYKSTALMADIDSYIYAENCHFKNVTTVYKKINNGSINIVNWKSEKMFSLTYDEGFLPSDHYDYKHLLISPDNVEEIVGDETTGAGPTLPISLPETNDIQAIRHQENVNKNYVQCPFTSYLYNLKGQRSAENSKGIFIKKGAKFLR